MAMLTLTPKLASIFARLALSHVEREYPNKLDHVLRGPADLRSPSDLHPIFYGSFDWHSCVHGYWLLATLLRIVPDLPEASRCLETRASSATNGFSIAPDGSAVYMALAVADGTDIGVMPVPETSSRPLLGILKWLPLLGKLDS